MKAQRNSALSGWIMMSTRGILLVLALALLAGCAQATPALLPTPTAAATAAQAPTATEPPPATPTLPPTATTPPTATPTLPPTATPLPPLALLKDGFSAWCAPQAYAGTKPAGPDAPDYGNKLVVKGDQMQIKIPAAYCTLSFTFNQAAPSGASMVFYTGKSAFLKVPLAAVDGRPDELWASVSHDYVINPPFWAVDYQIAVTGADDKELWSGLVKFAKPLPEECPFGGLPDPVTLYCTQTDPYEIEPHPDITYPYDHSKFVSP